jgi:hypothetical protein
VDLRRFGWTFDEDPDDYWDALDGLAKENLEGIFGSDLELWDESGTVDVGEGRASLGCLKPEKQPWLYVDHRGTIRMVLDYLMPSVDMSVNDLRLYEEKVEEGKKQVEELNRRFGEWYYVISAESFENLRLSRSDLVKAKEKDEAETDEDEDSQTDDETDS